MQELSILTPKPIRDIWATEPEFSKWLAEDDNIALLGNALDISISSDETEVSVGSYRADILAHEEVSNDTIIIENQYGKTDHDHLGKLITYASGRNAKVLIWIVEDVTDEHRSAIQWLNDHTEEGIGFFLIKIQIFTIDNSKPAPQFTIIESPNEWVKTVKKGELLPLKQFYFEWWKSLKEYAEINFKDIKFRNPQPLAWMSFAVGNAKYHIETTIQKRLNTIRTEIYIPDNKDLYKQFEDKKNKIEEELGFELKWELLPNKKASRISISRQCNFSSNQSHDEDFKWYCENVIKFRKVFPKHDK